MQGKTVLKYEFNKALEYNKFFGTCSKNLNENNVYNN